VILDEVDGTSLDLWMYAERYLGGGTRSYSSFSADLAIDDTYHPQRGLPSFELAAFWLDGGAGEYLANGIASGLHGLYRRLDRFLLPVHPQTMSVLGPSDLAMLAGRERGPVLTAVPCANARTVLVTMMDTRPVEPHFVKLHYPLRLSRFTRRLRRPIIGLQLWVAQELARVGVPFLPEVGGGVAGHDPVHAWGYLLRERRPSGSWPVPTVPLFALYGHDLRSPGDPSLLEQLVARSGLPASGFIADRIVRPTVRLWLKAALETGCALEMHGQNVLFGFSAADSARTDVCYRDCGVYVDPAIRRDLGLPDDLPPTNVIGKDVGWPREQVFSLAYDSFLGHHSLSFLARLAQQRLGVEPQELQAAAREEFAARPGAADLLPETIYYYDDQIHPDGGWRLVDTGLPPIWR
jgi:hypothetical protein